MQARHILPLTGVRIFAAVWVVLFHCHGNLPPAFRQLRIVDSFLSHGYLAVPFFFLLSGFILSYNYFPEYSLRDHPKFLFMRFARLWPVHVVTFILMNPFAGPEYPNVSVKTILEEAGMVRYWCQDSFGWNYPSWSISAEWFAYIFAFPLAWLSLRKIKSVLGLSVLVMALLAGHNLLLLQKIPGTGDDIFLIFLAGCALYRITCVAVNLPARTLQAAGIILFWCYLIFPTTLPAVTIYTAFALLILGLSCQQGPLAKFLSTKIVVYGGVISYSLYMTHALIFISYGLYTMDHPPQSGWARFAAACVVVAALAVVPIIFYHYIEVPANRSLRHLLRTSPFKVLPARALT